MSVEVDDTNELRSDLLDAEQIGAELGVNVKLVRRWMTDGDLRSVPLGRRRVVRRAWLEAFIDARAAT
jgi:predicted site-specific integrase-resolvase